MRRHKAHLSAEAFLTAEALAKAVAKAEGTRHKKEMAEAKQNLMVKMEDD